LDGIDFKNVITAAELVRLQWRPHGWLLWQMVPQGGITLLAGETASGKSFLGLDLALGVASGRGRAWDMELGDSSWVVGDRKRGPDKSMEPSSTASGSSPSLRYGDLRPFPEGRLGDTSSTASGSSPSLRFGDLRPFPKGRQKETKRTITIPYEKAETEESAQPSILSPLLGEGRQSRGEGDDCPKCPSSTAESTRLFETGFFDGPHLPWLDTGSSKGGQRDIEQKMVVPYNVQLKDPSQAQDDNPHRVRYFCADADPNLVAERVLRLCRGYPTGKNTMGIEVPEALDLDFHVHAFSDPESFNWLQKEVLSRGYQLLIFDGLAQYLPGMADGSASAVGAFLRGLRQLTSQTGVSVVLIHQFNKRLASRLNKWGIPTSQGEERVRGSSELLAGVDSVLLLSRPEAMKLGGMGRAVLKVVKNRLGQAGARLQFTIVDGDSSLHLLFERLGAQAQPKPRRLADAAFDEMMRILMTEDARKFDRLELTRLLGDRMHLPSSRTLTDTFRILGKDERVRVERDETGKKRYSWAVPGTGALESKVYGLPPAMALDVASSYLLSKARMNLAEQEMERMKDKVSSAELLGQLADALKRGDEDKQ